MFAHIVVFLSFIYAIAITHPLSSVHELVVERRRVRWSGLLACWMLTSVLLLILNWLSIFRLSEVTSWSTAQVLAHILAAVCIYFTCAFPAARARGNAKIDMTDYFARNRVPILGSFAVFGLIAILVNAVDLYSNGPAAGGTVDRIYGILPALMAEIAGLIVKANWFQWLVAIFVLCRVGYVLMVRVIVG